MLIIIFLIYNIFGENSLNSGPIPLKPRDRAMQKRTEIAESAGDPHVYGYVI